jgi:hypothetical protein
MHVEDVRSADHGDGTLIEVRFRHSARPDASFVVRFPLIDLEIDRPDEEYDEDTLRGRAHRGDLGKHAGDLGLAE